MLKKINITGGIGFDFTGDHLREQLSGHDGDIELSINSPGGDIYDGIEIFNEIKKYQRDTGSKVTAIFSGFVGSAASYLSMAADERVAYDNSVLMLHNASMIIAGDNRAFSFWAEDLKKTDNVIAKAYADATGKSRNEILKMMSAGDSNSGTYLYGEDILKEGFATKLIDNGSNQDKENATKESKILYANFIRSVKPKEYDHDRIVAMVNAVSDQELISASVTKARRLINAGDYDATTSWSFSASDGNALLGPDGDDWQNYGSWHLVRDTAFDDNTKAGFKYPYGKNEKVYRSALNAIAQRAAQAGLDNVSQTAQSLRGLIDKKENKGVISMDKEQVLNALTTLKENLAVTLPEIATHLNLSELIVTDDQKNALVKMNAVKALCGDADPVEFIKGILEERKQNAAAVREANIAEHFGAKQIDGKENKVRTYVDSIIGNVELTEEKLNEIKQNSIFQTLAAEQAQYDSDFNRIGVSEKNNASSGEPKVMDF